MSAASGYFQQTSPSGGIWHSLNRLLGILIFITLLAVVAYRFLPEITKRRETQAQVDKLKAAVELEKRKLARNRREEELLKKDPEYVALMIRDRLDLMGPNETIFRFEQAGAGKAKPAAK